jgi:Leucine-rich repeat (LRR) protein
MKNCYELEILSAPRNLLTEIPVWIYNFSKMKKMDLNGNRVQRIYHSINQLEELKELHYGM